MAAAAAASPVSGAQETPDIPADLVITLERTSCFGECPVYSVTIDARGNVTYEGKRFVRVVGRQTARIQTSRVAELLATAERVGFFGLRDRYSADVTDLPTTFVTITRGGTSKRVEDYYGAPAALKQLEEQIDAAAGSRRWIRLDAPELEQMVRDGWTPSAEARAELLRKALQYDEVDVVKGLLEIGADPNGSYFGTGTPPLMMVRSAAAARALIDAGASATARNDNGGTPLSWSTYLAPEVAEVLIKAGARVDDPTDPGGHTALWQAACAGNAGVVRLLLDAGANPTVRPNGVSAVECAQQTRDRTRTRPFLILDNKPPFAQDFDAVIALLEAAIARRKQR